MPMLKKKFAMDIKKLKQEKGLGFCQSDKFQLRTADDGINTVSKYYGYDWFLARRRVHHQLRRSSVRVPA